jgi:hypothetical protein
MGSSVFFTFANLADVQICLFSWVSFHFSASHGVVIWLFGISQERFSLNMIIILV